MRSDSRLMEPAREGPITMFPGSHVPGCTFVRQYSDSCGACRAYVATAGP
jgi:hypothetical protein